jgi:trk system potassium uptake protein TrkH
MIFAATNMTFHWLVFSKGRLSKYSGDPEFKYFCTFGIFAAIFIFFTLLISGSLGDLSFFEAFIKSLFISFSSMSTTGFYPDEIGNMPLTVIIIVIILLFLGGSTGSTSGGFKILRIKILMRHANKEISRLAHPHSIVPIRWNDINVSSKTLRAIWSFLFIFLTAAAFIGIAYGGLGYDFQTSIGLTTANLFSAGGLIGLISPDFIGYHGLSEFGKWFTSFVMIIGRLEIIAFMMFFIPSFWKN